MRGVFTICLLLLILSGCRWQDPHSLHLKVKEPDAVPDMSLGRVVQLPDMKDQLLVEVIVVNKGKCPVALDLNRFSIEFMSLDPEDNPWSLFGWFDSMSEICVMTVPANSSNRFVMATSYIGPCNTSAGTDWDERRWSERKGGDYHLGLYYAPPPQTEVDYLWSVVRFKNGHKVALEVGTCTVTFSKRVGDRSPTWQEWRNGRTHDPQKARLD